MRTIVFRPTNDCNLRCKYCYDANSHINSCSDVIKSSNDVFEKEYDQLLKDFEIIYDDNKHLHLIFHGGEPLLIKSYNIDRLCTDLKSIGDIEYSIQTNGTLINKDIIEVLKKHNFKVGISLDGCNEKQNSERVFSNEKNSYNVVMNKIRLLQEEDIKFGIIMSIAKQHTGCEQELYNFIGNNNLYCNVRPIFADPNTCSSTVMTGEEYSTFFNNLFDIWFNDKDKKVNTNQIMDFKIALKEVIYKNYHKNRCSTQNNCFENFISLDVHSNLYACNRLYGNKEFYYGNLKENSYDDIKKKIEKLTSLRQSLIEKSCGDCEIYDKCYGGCPAEAYRVSGDIGEKSPLCKIKKLTREHIYGEVYE